VAALAPPRSGQCGRLGILQANAQISLLLIHSRRSITLYVIDLTHYLDAKGAIASERGAARKFADFVTAVVAHATDFDRSDDTPGPLCIKCRKRDQRAVETALTEDDFVIWRCMVCGTLGQVSNWQESFWDMRSGAPSD
jgi:hypothetical protein